MYQKSYKSFYLMINIYMYHGNQSQMSAVFNFLFS